MAKRKKLQDNNPPRRVEIRGQDHLLAYITPEEAKMLMANGGSGTPGPMGIPAFDRGLGGPGGSAGSSGAGGASGASGGSGTSDGSDNDDGGMPGDDTGQGSSSGSYGGAVGGGRSDDFDADLADLTGAQVGPSYGGGMSQAEIDAAINDAMAALGPNVSEYGVATDDFGSNLFGGQYYPVGTEYGQQNYQAVTDVYNQIEKAKQYQQPIEATLVSLLNPIASLPKLQSLATQFMGPRFINALAKPGHTPIEFAGRVVGVRDQYGTVVEGRDPSASDAGGNGDGYDSRDPVKPVNPVTGQCDEGYIFDEDLQACRMDTSSGTTSPVAPPPAFAPGAYARMGLLDVAPGMSPGKSMAMYGNLSGAGQFDFDAANRAFRMATATRPEYYSDPYDLTGYTLLA